MKKRAGATTSGSSAASVGSALRAGVLAALLALAPATTTASARVEQGQSARSSYAAVEPLLGFVGSGRSVVLTRLDPRTLMPLAGARLRVGSHSTTWAFSRDRLRLALVAPQSGVLVVDVRTLRALARLTGPRYRLGPELDLSAVAWTARGLVAIASCLCAHPGDAYVWIDWPDSLGGGGRGSEIDLGEPAVLTWAPTRTGLAVLADYGADPTTLDVDLLDAWGSDDVRLDGVTSPLAPALAVDVARNRLFVLAPDGVIAEIAGSTTGRPKTVSYHAVEYLPTVAEQPLRRGAAWLGSDALAFWGMNGAPESPAPAGLTIIDTRTWTARILDQAVGDAVAVPGSIIGWRPAAPGGIIVYGSDGTRRFRVLAGHPVRWVAASTRYAYVWADCPWNARVESCSRFSVDLRNGRVAGPLRSRATPLLP